MFVVDPDAHYMEDTRQLAEYLPEPMRTRLGRTAPSHILSNSTGDRWVMGRIQRPEVNYPNAYSEPEEIPGIMKFLGVDIYVQLPIVYHANGGSVDHFPIKGFQQFLETHTLGFLFYNLATMTSMLVQGVPERFPHLKFAFQEAGLFYIPMLMHRLDAAYRRRRAEAPLLKRLPSEYMLDFSYGTQPMEEPNKEEHLEMIFEMIVGPNTLVFSSDYPHWDYDLPSKITSLGFLDDDAKAKILGGNAMNLYRFEGR